MKLQPTLSFLCGILVLLVIPGCISPKKIEEFKQKHSDADVFDYTVNNKALPAAFQVEVFMVDRHPEAQLTPQRVDPAAVFQLEDFKDPAVKVRIAPPVFLKKSHQGQFRLQLSKEGVVLSNGFTVENKEDVFISKKAEELFFNLDKTKASPEEVIELELQLIDEDGNIVPSENLLFSRYLSFELPLEKKATEEPCPEMKFTIEVSSFRADEEGVMTEEPVAGAQLFNDELGLFETDTNGMVELYLCQDSLPLSYTFSIEAPDHQSMRAKIIFQKDQPVNPVELESLPDNQLTDKDTDEDGIPDSQDDCPDRPGPLILKGCPEDRDNVIKVPETVDPEKGTKSLDPAMEEAYWDAIKGSSVPGDFEEYLDNFPEGQYVEQAQRRLQETYTQIAKGLMSILVPDTMALNVPEVVTVVVSSDTSLSAREKVIDEYIDLQDLPPSDIPEVRSELIKITEIMRAELRDPSPPGDRKFFIDPSGEREQKVDLYGGGDPTVWNWTATPLQKGKWPLKVIVSIIFDQKGKEVPKVEEQIFQVEIVVEPGFFEKNAYWIGGGSALLLLLVFLFLYRRRRRKQEVIRLSLPYQKIIDLIGEGEIEEALEILQNSLKDVSDKHYQQVILLKSRLAENEEKYQAGVIETKESTLQQNRITQSVLSLMSKLKEEFEIE